MPHLPDEPAIDCARACLHPFDGGQDPPKAGSGLYSRPKASVNRMGNIEPPTWSLLPVGSTALRATTTTLRYFFFASRRIGDSARVKRTTSSPVDGADVVVQGQHLDAGDLLDHRFHDRPGRFDQMGPHLLEQVPPLLGRKRLDQMLFGRGQHALKADHEEIAEQVGVNVLGSPAHVVLLEATDSFANGGFDFSLGLHGNLHGIVIS